LKTLAPQIFQATVPPHWGLDLQRDYRRRTFEIKPAANGLGYLRTQYRAALITLMVVVGVVLLIACANIANLLLVRAAVRQKEIAVRLAIGAGRGRLIRQLLTESVVLSLMGASFGILFANWGSTLLVRYLSSRDNQVFLDLAISLRVLGFTAVVAVTTGILFGVAPAWRGTRVPLSAAMKGNTGGLSGGRARLGLGKALVVFQVALSLVLLVGASLLAATFWKLATVDAGFDRENVLLVSVDLRNARYPNERLFGVYDEILDTLRTLPGVRSASYSRLTPVSGNWWNEWVRVDGYTPTSSDPPMVFFNRVSSRFFETLDTPLLAGRDFNTHDSKNSPPVAIVNETMAKKYFHGTNPIGKGFRIGEPDATPGKWTEIIGIAKDAKYRELRETIPPIAYVPMRQDPDSRVSNTYELRTTGAPSEAIAAVRTAFERMNKNIDLEFHTLALQVNESLSRERLLATLSGFFGALALLLASVGLYGVMSYTVASRRNEIGIRMALGAEQGRILWMVLREVLLLVAAGMAIGFATAAATTRLIASMLYGLEATDPSTMALAGTFLLGVAAVAGYLPACSAARLNPMITLREE
jgi:predicted permease